MRMVDTSALLSLCDINSPSSSFHPPSARSAAPHPTPQADHVVSQSHSTARLRGGVRGDGVAGSSLHPCLIEPIGLFELSDFRLQLLDCVMPPNTDCEAALVSNVVLTVLVLIARLLSSGLFVSHSLILSVSVLVECQPSHTSQPCQPVPINKPVDNSVHSRPMCSNGLTPPRHPGPRRHRGGRRAGVCVLSVLNPGVVHTTNPPSPRPRPAPIRANWLFSLSKCLVAALTHSLYTIRDISPTLYIQ